MANQKPPLIFLLGPTASGKSALAYALAERLPVEIISVDATQVYRGLDIGSAKPSAEEQAKVPHHLIDIRDPAIPYSAANFRKDAMAVIEKIHRRGNTPLLVGGTMLYFKVLLSGLADLPAADEAVRQGILAEAAQYGWPALHKKLAEVDPDTANRLHPNHSQRIARALEVYRMTGKSMTELHRLQDKQDKLSNRYALVQLAINPAREHLHQAITTRFRQMLELGFEQEVRELKKRKDLSLNLPSIRSVGYRQMWSYLDGEMSVDQMLDRAVAATRQLAKRQVTWLRRWDNLQLLDTEESKEQRSALSEIRDRALNCIESVTI